MCPISLFCSKEVYAFFGASFFMCAYLVVAKMNTFFLYSIYFRFIIASQIRNIYRLGRIFAYLTGARIKICVLNGGEYCLLNGGENRNAPSVRFFSNPYTKIFAVYF